MNYTLHTIAPKGSRRAIWFVMCGGLTVAAVVWAAMRLHFGVDFTDEAYYASIPYRFALGDVPYVSELNVRQNAGVIITPLVWLWLRVADSGEGLILFLRYLYLGARLALFALAARAFWNRASRELVMTASGVMYAFVLFSIPALSYNTLAGSLFGAALLCLLLWRDQPRSRWAAGVFGFSALSAFVHPALLPAAAGIGATVIWKQPSASERRVALRMLAGVAIAIALIMLALYARVGQGNLERLLVEARWYTGPAAGIDRLVAMPARLMYLSNFSPLLPLCWLLLWFAPRLPAALPAVLATCYVGIALLADTQATMVWLALGALPMANAARLIRRDAELLIVSVLSLAAGLLVGLFSTNGISNVAVGSEVAVIVFFIASYQTIEARAVGSRRSLLAHVPTVLAILTVLRLSVAQWRDVYRDDPVYRLSSIVDSGPYAGIRTSRSKHDYIERIQAALRTYSGQHQSFIAFNGFPAAHLMVPLRPALPMTWVPDNPAAYVRSLRIALAREVPRSLRPVLVLQVLRLPITTSSQQRWTYDGEDAFVNAVMAEHPRLLRRTEEFVLYEIR